MTDSKEQVETLGVTIRESKGQVAQKVWELDDDNRWHGLVIGCAWKNGQNICEFRKTVQQSGVLEVPMGQLQSVPGPGWRQRRTARKAWAA